MIADAKTTCKKLVALADKHGTDLRIWGCGGGMDRIVQISSLTDFIQADNMRPLNGPKTLSSAFAPQRVHLPGRVGQLNQPDFVCQ